MEINNQVIEVLEYLSTKMGVVIDWTAENVMPYLRDLTERMISYQIVNKSIQIGISALLMIGLTVATVLMLKKALKACRYSTGWEVAVPFIALFGPLSVIGMVIWFGCTLASLLKWIYLPELQMVEYITNLIGTMSGGVQ